MRWESYGILLIACGFSVLLMIHRPPSTELTVLVDVSDAKIHSPTLYDIAGFLPSLDHERWSGMTVRIGVIDALPIGSFTSIQLDPVPLFARNALVRKQSVTDFTNAIHDALAAVALMKRGRPQSAIVERVLYAIETTSKKPNGVVMVYSDFLENSDVVSVYTANGAKDHITTWVTNYLNDHELMYPPSVSLIIDSASIEEFRQALPVIAGLQEALHRAGVEVTIDAP